MWKRKVQSRQLLVTSITVSGSIWHKHTINMSNMGQALTSFQRELYYILYEEGISVCVVGCLNMFNTLLYIIKMCTDLLLSLYLIVTLCLNSSVFISWWVLCFLYIYICCRSMMMVSFLELFAQVVIYSCKQLCNFLTCWWRVRRKLGRCGKIRYVKNDKAAPNLCALN